MKFGIYYAYWEKEWGGDFLPYIPKVKKLGYDILEVACGDFHTQPMGYFTKLREAAQKEGVTLTGGYGPRPQHNLASTDPAVVESAFAFYRDIFPKMQEAGIAGIGGALYSYWPVDYTVPIDKEGDFARSVSNMKTLADMAAPYGITLHMEALNRFEGYMLNTASEAVRYVEAVGKPNVKILLDTFHMNIEEDSLPGAIKTAGKHLGRLHVGEANRRPPRAGESRVGWPAVAAALHAAGYDGDIVAEPFVQMGGQVGSDIKMWRDLTTGGGESELDAEAEKSVQFLRDVFAAGAQRV